MQKGAVIRIKENDGGQKKRILTNASEIKTFNAEVTKLFKGSGLLLRPGCLLKTNQEYYENYGFKATPENKKELLKEINKFYEKDREDEAEEKTINPRGLIIQPYAHYTNMIVDWIAKITKKIIEKKQNNKEIKKICCIGSRDGMVALAIINALKEINEQLPKKVQFYLIEPHRKKLEATVDKLNIYGLRSISETKEGGFSAEYKTDDEFLATQNDKEFDVVISYFHLHCKPFSDTLGEIRRVLKDDGLFIITDYFSPLPKHPLLVAELLRRVGAEEELIKKFIGYFDVGEKIDLSERDLCTLKDHIDYLEKVNNQIRTTGIKPQKPIYFLRANTPVEERIRILRQYNLTTEIKEINERTKNILAKIDKIENPKRISEPSDFVSLIMATRND